jgi:hypothetical protein
LSKEEEALILKYRQSETDNGWAKIASVIHEKFKIKRTPNQIKNNYNQRLKKQLGILESVNTTESHEKFEYDSSSVNKMSISFVV